jgi:nitroimidazol reductase NimA-like FMN-containing flavoprotein (pyridoxamine 5'-phosphate oxidase superfamily)
MTLDQQTELSEERVDAVLSDHESGVLTLARDDEPYAIPVSYGYDATERRLYLRLVSTPDGEKRRFLSSAPKARFVVYGERDGVYRSVVAEGRLETVPRDELTVERIEQYGRAERPLFELWKETRHDLDVELYELDPDTLSGRRVERDSPPTDSDS